MARRRSGGGGGGRGGRWWWLAPPLIGGAAYLAFDATLGVLVPDEERAPRASHDAAPASGAQVLADGPPGTAALAPDASGLAPAADVEPAPSPTATEQRAAAPAGAARKPARKSLPRESLTDADRRALEQVLEGNAPR